VPLHALPLFERWTGVFPRAEQAAREVISLPIGPTLDPTDQARIVEAVIDALNRA
jgi:dTDP-4-amino-4,6-dideoxygalactose transaminase